ncbi:O-antigen ligase family protein [Leisingera sp. S232]|uniref:O-antigen ligase family protein n=1 Tax=Leisingera sp. S232 TaxID=3415132 RepID=UPI00086E1DE3|nr:hypothetical protein AB838_04700 [Rhodobacteraceae bacterium (ex Bugula neritina AB1)]
MTGEFGKRLTSRIQDWQTAVWGGASGLLVVLVGLLANPVLTIAMPIGLMLGLLLFWHPFLGVLSLAVFAHLDAVEKLLFGFLPLSYFKLTAAACAVVMILRGSQLRAQIRTLLSEPVAILGLVFLVLAFVSALFASNKAQALDALKTYISLYLLMVLVIVFAATKTRIRLLLYMLAATSLATSLLLFLDLYGGISIAKAEAATTARTAEGFDRSSGGSDYNPTTAASLLLTGVIFALVHALESPRLRMAMLATVVLGTLAVILSFARSAVVGYGVIGLLLMWRYRHEKFLPPMIICALFGLVLASPFIPGEYWERLWSIFGGSGGDWTLGRRWSYNLIGLNLLGENPVLGVGPGNFPHHFTNPEYRYLPGRTLLGRELHNMFLSVAVQMGLASLSFFFMLGYGLARLRAVLREPADAELRVLARALIYAFGAYLIVSLFLPNEFTKYTWLLTAQAAALFQVNKSLKGRT